MKKNKIYDILIIILLYIGISCLPFDLIPVPSFVHYIFKILAQVAIIIFIRYFLKKSPLSKDVQKKNSISIVWFIPLFIVCFSNFFCLIDKNNSVVFSFDIDLIFAIMLSLFIAYNEEYIFRMLLIDNLNTDKPIMKILISSTIFAACHLSHFLSSFNPVDLIDVVYTFFIGIILGLIFVYTNKFVFVYLFHASYNVINGDFSRYWIHFGSASNSFYLINITVGIIAAVYIVLIYFIKLRKESK